MTNEIFEQIKKAIETLQNGTLQDNNINSVKRIDGNDWSAYLVGRMVRVDIKPLTK